MIIDPAIASALESSLVAITIAFGVYFGLYQLFYLTIVVRAIGAIADERRWASDELLSGTFASPLTPGVTVIVPAHNESAGVVASVESLLRLQYPRVQIVVVDDGSRDGTSDVLRARFPMSATDEAPVSPLPVIGTIESVHRFDEHDALLIRKTSMGRRADAVNAAVQYARHELVCMIDGDSILSPTALLRVVQPFIDDPTVVASGGIVRPANGAVLIEAEVDRVEMPDSLIERVQVLEYLRAFLVGRAGWSAIKGLLIISGAFGVFRRDTLIELGGLDAQSLAEDAELVVAAHRHHRSEREPYRIVFVADPVCWTEVPASWPAVARQRKRWSQGLGELLRGARDMMLRPRFGALGMVTLPYFWLFEQWGAPLVLLALVIAIASGPSASSRGSRSGSPSSSRTSSPSPPRCSRWRSSSAPPATIEPGARCVASSAPPSSSRSCSTSRMRCGARSGCGAPCDRPRRSGARSSAPASCSAPSAAESIARGARACRRPNR